MEKLFIMGKFLGLVTKRLKKAFYSAKVKLVRKNNNNLGNNSIISWLSFSQTITK